MYSGEGLFEVKVVDMKPTLGSIVSVALFSFFLHFVWEIFQVPFYKGMTDANHFDASLFCLRATVGDVGIALLSYWVVGRVWSDNGWVLNLNPSSILLYTGLTVSITVVIEILSTEVWSRWIYSELMPVVPGIHVGLVPIVQWLVISPVSLILARTFLVGLKRRS